MTTRRVVLRGLSAAALPLILARSARSAAKPVIGVLVNDIRRNSSVPQMTEGLRDLGYVDGKNIELAIRSAEGDPGALPRLAQELARLKVELIFATGPAAIGAARAATSTIPIVALDLESDPVAAGWAKSLAHPAGNVTGLFLDLPTFAGKWLELVKEVDPGLRRVGILWDTSAGTAQLGAAREAAQRLMLETAVYPLRSAGEIAAVFETVARDGMRGVIMLSSPMISQESSTIAQQANRHRLVAVSPFRTFVDAGGLMSYGPRFDDFRRRAALFVVKILKGAKPGELPIEQPTKFELVVNLKAAKSLGVTIPQSLLVRADEVIQ